MSELAELAWAGWPFTLALAAVMVARTHGQARRTEALNRALHELRRPLQALALGAGPYPADGNGPPPLELAICALADLDRVVNGQPALPRKRLLRLRPVIEGCIERWALAAELSGGRLDLDWRAGAAAVVADPKRIAQALDNLVLNAIEHGAPPVKVSVVICERGARISVSDHGTLRTGSSRRTRAGRSGHGLRVAAAVAAEHGGRFAIQRAGGTTQAVLELPLASLPLPALAGSRAA